MDGSALRRSLGTVAERILDLAPGTLEVRADGSPVARLGETLARRNLGLVRVAQPEAFSWPGHWIGIVEEAGERSAVLMFGVPSAPLDPAVRGAPIDGYVIAPFDLHRPHDTTAYGLPAGAGSVVGIYTAPDREAPCTSHDACRVVPGRGLDGDRYALGSGTFSSGDRKGQDLTLIEQEALDDLRRVSGIDLPPAAARRNLVTRGIRLEPLVGTEFTIGDVRCYAARLAEPCAHLQRLTEQGVLRGLVHRGGIRVDVLSAGVIRVGDEVARGLGAP